jgi:hypothetical protein
MASQILRVSIIGTQPGGEVWSTNPCWEINGSTGEAVSQAEALTIATALNAITIPTPLLSCMGTQTRVTGVRVEARQLSGILEAQAEAARATPVVGTGPNIHPHGTSLVCSLRTPGVGPSARGRMYWPATGQALDNTDYRIASANVTSLLTAFKTLLSGMETAIQVTLPEANLTVWSRSTSNFHNVNALQVGNIPDSQRRRRDTLNEAYQGTTYP